VGSKSRIFKTRDLRAFRPSRRNSGAAALLLRKIGPVQADAAKDLAYCLYDICTNKRRDAAEAASYNGLIAVWSELTRQAAEIRDTREHLQGSLEL